VGFALSRSFGYAPALYRSDNPHQQRACPAGARLASVVLRDGRTMRQSVCDMIAVHCQIPR
jgi:hypothetical protein